MGERVVCEEVDLNTMKLVRRLYNEDGTFTIITDEPVAPAPFEFVYTSPPEPAHVEVVAEPPMGDLEGD